MYQLVKELSIYIHIYNSSDDSLSYSRTSYQNSWNSDTQMKGWDKADRQ